MLKVVFSFIDESPTDPIGFELGDLEFRGEAGAATSNSINPNQSMMLVLSIINLLDGLRQFLSTPKEKEYEFIGVDSSFRVVFRRLTNDTISISSDHNLIHSTTSSQLKQ